MTVFPASTNPAKVRVAQYRELIGYGEHVCARIERPSCTKREVIRERSTGLLALFRAMRELQAVVCPRRNADDTERYDALMTKAHVVFNAYCEDYFGDHVAISSAQTDEEIHDNWIRSSKADDLTYLMSPVEYPEQHARVLVELGIAVKGARRTSTGVALMAV